MLGSTLLIQNIVSLRETVVRILSLIHSKNADSLDEALALVRNFFSVDRVSLVGFDRQANELYYVNQSNADRVDPLPFMYDKRRPVDDHAWIMELLQQGKAVMVNDLADIPPAEVSERQFMEYLKTLAYLIVPVEANRQMEGFLVMENLLTPRIWTSLDAENLRILAPMFAIGIDREKARRAAVHSSHQLLKGESLFRYVFDNLAWAVELYDENGCLFDMNPADLELFGYTREQAIGLSLYDNPNITHEQMEQLRRGEDLGFAMMYNFKLAKEKGYFSSVHEDAFKLIRGFSHPVKDAYNKLLFYFTILFDDTENYLRDEELKRNLAKLKAAIDTGDSFIWEFDEQEETSDELLDYTASTTSKEGDEAYAPRTLNELFDSIHPDDRDAIRKNVYTPLMNGDRDHCSATYRRLLDGHTCWYMSNVRVSVRDKKGKPVKVLCYSTDITREKEQEMELLRAQEADRLKTAFMGNISHEVRTPLNSIVGFSNFLVDLNSTPETETFRKIINKNNSLLLQLVDDILDFSKIELGTLDYCITSVSVHEIAKEVVSLYEPLLPAAVSFVFDNSLPAYQVYADRKRVRQVLAQFVSNASKHTRQGTITLSYALTANNQCLMKLEDTGVGLTEANRQKVFDSFYKENAFNQGIGLGLPIAKAMVEAMGGEIGVDSVPGKGSVFWFTLPLSEESCKHPL